MAAKTRRERALEDYGPTTQTLLHNQRIVYQKKIEDLQQRIFEMAAKLWRLEGQLRAARCGLNKEERDAIQREERLQEPWQGK